MGLIPIPHGVIFMITLGFKVSEEEDREILRQAKIAGGTVSELVRRRAMGKSEAGSLGGRSLPFLRRPLRKTRRAVSHFGGTILHCR